MPPDSSDQTDADIALHQRLIAGDPTASLDLCERYLPRLQQTLSRQFATTNSELVHDAVVDATLDFIDYPHRYDPSKRSLFGYLLMSARGDLINLRRRHRVWIEEKQIDPDVELDDLLRNNESDADDLAAAVVDEIIVTELRNDVLNAAHDEEERTVLNLMIEGARSTDEFASALGWDSLSAAERRSGVYKIKDRLNQRLKRLRAEAARD